jgi:Tol biopolymer transport system component
MATNVSKRAIGYVLMSSWLALGVGAPAPRTTGLDAANDAWLRGDYIPALNGYIQALSAPGRDDTLEQIALTTGELYRTDEITDDGRAGRFSPDGRYIVYETGLETSRRTRILKNDASRALVADLPGISATFTSDSSKVAYLRVNDTDDVRKAGQALDAATLTQQDRSTLVQMLGWLIARDSSIEVRDVASGFELDLTTPSMLKSSLTYSADGRSLYFLGAREGNDTRTDIYRISESSDGPVLAVDAGGLKAAPIVDPSGATLVYVIPGVSPLRRPGPPVPATDAGGGRAGGAVPPRPPSTFAIVDLASKRVSVVPGTAPTLSADGRTLAYVARDGAEFNLMVGPTTGLQVTVKRTTQRLDAPALSADGARVAWQMMPRDDWEIFVADVAGSALTGERRVTREIQHDVLPRFLTASRLIAMMGEPRHRRSYLYDLGPGALADAAGDTLPARTRLFHNNTVRTIAPEYQWSPSPDGTQLLIGAERDGDTVSPARGVYLLDLKRKVTRANVLARLRENLKSETALKAAGIRAFQPLAAQVRQVLSHESVERIFGYEKALFDFDSKNITRPGNRRASEFLYGTYASFGYTPEYQWFEPRNALGGKTANVVATLRGTVNPELVYVVSSHYDSVEAGPGADDDTSGTAALLEAARVLAGHPLPATVVFASMTGEEAGLLGSREFVHRAVASKTRIVGVLNNDMVGWMNDERMDNTIRYSNPGIRDIQHAAAMLFTKLITYDALYWKGTDAMSFYDVYGDVIGGIGSYPVLGSPYYHQATDLLENENHQLIAETSKATVATIMLLASSPSRLTHVKVDSYTGAAASLSWAPSPEKGVTSYVIAYGPRSSPMAHRLTVTQPHAVLPQVAPGEIVSVKAVNAAGLEGWDWARVSVAETKRPALTP